MRLQKQLYVVVFSFSFIIINIIVIVFPLILALDINQKANISFLRYGTKFYLCLQDFLLSITSHRKS